MARLIKGKCEISCVVHQDVGSIMHGGQSQKSLDRCVCGGITNNKSIVGNRKSEQPEWENNLIDSSHLFWDINLDLEIVIFGNVVKIKTSLHSKALIRWEFREKRPHALSKISITFDFSLEFYFLVLVCFVFVL